MLIIVEAEHWVQGSSLYYPLIPYILELVYNVKIWGIKKQQIKCITYIHKHRVGAKGGLQL